MPSDYQPARLVLEDGSVWQGRSFGAPVDQRLGEVIFNTGMTGYQEVLTDPSYSGQIVVMTAPQIGNTGINLEDDESRQIFLRAFVVREISPVVSNWRSELSLPQWLQDNNVPAITDVDTRALTRRIREQGTLKGVISTDESLNDAALVEAAQAWHGLDDIDLVKDVTTEESYHWVEGTDDEWEFRQWQVDAVKQAARQPHIVAYDFGIKRNILRRMATYGAKVTVVPASTSAEEVKALNPDGVFLSNGPGDPSALPYAVNAARELLAEELPMFGICLGHQIMGQAFGGKTYRLKFGHHGINQPVKEINSDRVEISTHNHNFAIDPATLPDDVEVNRVNLNDDCCEGMRHKHLPAMSIQYHPEAGPGPHDSDMLFVEFMNTMAERIGATTPSHKGLG